MEKKERLSKDSRKMVERKGWIIFLFLIIVVGSGFFVYRYFSSPPEKGFGLEEKGSEIVVHGLEREEIDKINWEKGMKWTPYVGERNQYRFSSEETNFFWKLFRKPTIYYAIGTWQGEKLKDKELKFANFDNIKDKKIREVEYVITKKNNMFHTGEGITLASIFWFVFYLLSTVFLIYMIDNAFGTNILGFLFFPFKAWQKDEGRISLASKIGFKDVGGLHEAKEELGEVVTYFHNPQAFWQRGAKVPKGILLVGPPGNGKTLLAKALAGECGLPFLSRSGSDFEEMMVGVGARRIRDLFRQARSYPQGCIIFIDEVDSIGRKRYSAHTNHTELTLNQFLSELDGFHPRENIIVLAATNSLSVLDSALLRPGRFDRQIYVPFPNLKGRREIIILHIQKIPRHRLDLEEIAAMTKGLSGAQIANIFNEASILTIRYRKNVVDQEIFFEAFDRVLMGPSLTSHTITPEKKRIVAYHEAGHAIIGLSLPETRVKKITIIPRWTAGGYTWTDLRGEQDDDYLINKSQMLAQVMISLGGRASEELIFGREYITMGAYSDFKSVSETIRQLILRYGMSELGIVPTQETFFYEEELPPHLPETTKQKIENEREKILNQCWQKTRNILRQNQPLLELFARLLLQRQVLHHEEIIYLFINQTSPYTPFLN